MCHCWKRSRLRCHQAHECQWGQSLEQWQHWALCWMLQAGVSHGKCHGKHRAHCEHIITHLVGRLGTLLLQESSGNRTRAALKGKGLEKGRAGLFVLPMRLHHHTGEDHPLDLLLLSPRVGWSQGQQDSPRLWWASGQCGTGCSVWPWQWCQDDTRWFPQILSPQWAGCAQEDITHPEQATCIPVLADVEQQLLLQMCFALLMAQVSSAESCPTSPGIPCAGRGNSLPCLPLPLEHFMWAHTHWSHIWQVYSLEFLISLQQELMEKGRGHGRDHFVLICVLLSACQCK